MHIKKTPLITVMASAIALTLGCTVISDNNKKTMKTDIKLINEALTSFSITKDIDDLRQGVQFLNRMPKYGIDPKTRTNSIRAFLEVYRVIVQSMDPKFDPRSPEYIVQMNIVPPSEAGFSGGSDPSAISDIALRKKYEAALAENARRAAYANRQDLLALFKNEVELDAEVYVGNVYLDGNVKGSFEELSDLLSQENDIDHKFKDRLLAQLIIHGAGK